MKIAFIIIVAIFLIPYSNAYIDPGTGSLIISSAWSYIAGAVGVIIGFITLKVINPIKKRISKKNKKH